MEDNFIPEKEIPDILWDFISRVKGDAGKAHNELKIMNKEEICNLFRIFLDAKTEMVDVLSTRYEKMEITEDTIDDLCDAIITKGKDEYISIFYGKSGLPPRNAWEDLDTIGYVFSEVYFEKFNKNIFYIIDE